MKEKVNSEAVRNSSVLKTLAVAAAMSVTPLVQGATYDIAAGDVTDLTNKLATCRDSSTTLRLAAGDYDLTGIQMEEEGSPYGKTHLVVSGVQIKGMGNSREDVRLIGDGTCRVVRFIDNIDASLECLTITNGYAKAIDGAANSGHGGGVYGNQSVTNCVITGCRADNNGGGAGYYTKIWACDILNNDAAAGGGAFAPTHVVGSLVSGNSSSGHGGGIHGNGNGRVEKTDVIANVAGGSGGGICAVKTVTDCTVSQNRSAGNGSAFFSWGRGGAIAQGCTICSNKTASSGAVHEYTVVGGEMFANYSGNYGGGASFCNLGGVEIYNNCANKYGGGVYNCNVTNCTLRNNFFGTANGAAGANSYNSILWGCDISGTGVDRGSAVNCDFHDIMNNTAISDNPHVSDIVWSGHVYSSIPVCTNCIFRNNVVTNFSYTSLMCGVSGSTKKGAVINCTIVSNKWGSTFNYMNSKEGPVTVKNCVFIWNQGRTTTDACDLHAAEENVSSNGLRFANCAYGSATGHFAAGKISAIEDSSDGPMYKFGTDGFPADPGFVLKNTDHPFEPKRTSPLRGLGAPEDWRHMSDATDIRGEGFPRLRDGALDIGCYQCWIMPIGTVLSIR